jgi:antitoxin component of MazEF toxin-antitoxin module
MNKQIQIKKEIKKVGTGYHIIIPTIVLKSLDLDENDEVLVTLEKAADPVTYRCKRCEYTFDTLDNLPECPACMCSDIEELTS